MNRLLRFIVIGLLCIVSTSPVQAKHNNLDAKIAELSQKLTQVKDAAHTLTSNLTELKDKLASPQTPTGVTLDKDITELSVPMSHQTHRFNRPTLKQIMFLTTIICAATVLVVQAYARWAQAEADQARATEMGAMVPYNPHGAAHAFIADSFAQIARAGGPTALTGAANLMTAQTIFTIAQQDPETAASLIAVQEAAKTVEGYARIAEAADSLALNLLTAFNPATFATRFLLGAVPLITGQPTSETQITINVGAPGVALSTTTHQFGLPEPEEVLTLPAATTAATSTAVTVPTSTQEKHGWFNWLPWSK